MSSKKQRMTTLVFLFIMMILAAIVENTKGVFIPSFKAEFGVNDNTISNMLILCSAAYMVLTYVGGTLCEKVGQKTVFLSGLTTMVVSLMILSGTKSYGVLLVGFAGTGAGLALTSIASNTILPMIVLSAQTIIMNMLHASYGLGSSIGQSIFGTLTTMGIDWRKIYFVVGIIYLVILIAFIFVKIPKTHVRKVKSNITMKELLTNKIVLLYIGALGLYVFAEQGVGNWFVNYMKFSYNMDEQKASIYLAIFFAVITVGRLVGGIIVERRGYFNTLYQSLIIAAVLFFAGLFMGENGMIIVALSGLFFAITFPTAVLTMSKVFKEKSAYITGVLITSASFVGMVMNKVIGILNEVVGPNKAFFIIPISVVGSAVFMIYLYKNTKGKLQVSKGN